MTTPLWDIIQSGVKHTQLAQGQGARAKNAALGRAMTILDNDPTAEHAAFDAIVDSGFSFRELVYSRVGMSRTNMAWERKLCRLFNCRVIEMGMTPTFLVCS